MYKKLIPLFVLLMVIIIIFLLPIWCINYYLPNGTKHTFCKNILLLFHPPLFSENVPKNKITLVNKIFITTYMSGEVGIFKSDGTIISSFGINEPVPEPRLKTKIGTWKLDGDILIVSGTAISDGKYNFQKMVQKEVDNTSVYGDLPNNYDSQNWDSGFIIAENLDILNKLTDVSFFRSLMKNINLK